MLTRLKKELPRLKKEREDWFTANNQRENESGVEWIARIMPKLKHAHSKDGTRFDRWQFWQQIKGVSRGKFLALYAQAMALDDSEWERIRNL